MDEDDDFYDDDYEPDPIEEAMEECGQYLSDDGHIFCSMVATEHCDFCCPFRSELGKHASED